MRGKVYTFFRSNTKIPTLNGKIDSLTCARWIFARWIFARLINPLIEHYKIYLWRKWINSLRINRLLARRYTEDFCMGLRLMELIIKSWKSSPHPCVHACMYVCACVCVCMYVCVYVCVCVFVQTMGNRFLVCGGYDCSTSWAFCLYVSLAPR